MNFAYNKEIVAHSIELVDRKELKITGVTQIISFDDLSVVMLSDCGEIEIDGNSLNIDALDLERKYVAVSGEISGINYIERVVKKKKRFWGGE